MAVKQVVVPGIGQLSLYKRRGSRSIRLSLTHDGRVRVTLPTWTPYRAGIQFAQSKARWIGAQRPAAASLLRDGQAIGKAHCLRFVATAADSITTRLQAEQATVKLAAGQTPNDTAAQQAARAVAIRALRQEAENLLPPRLAALAGRHGFRFRSIAIRQLSGRWGSCDQQANLTFNLFLMQLPWALIDYVLLHELVHTQVLRHGPDFWAAFEQAEPRARSLRSQMKPYRPTVL